MWINNYHTRNISFENTRKWLCICIVTAEVRDGGTISRTKARPKGKKNIKQSLSGNISYNTEQVDELKRRRKKKKAEKSVVRSAAVIRVQRTMSAE